jgi:hypothetical protein
MKFPTLIQRTTLLLAAFAPTTQCSPYSSTTARPARIAPNSAFLKSFSEQTSLPACIWTAKGTHTAKGYTNAAAETTSIEGMQADCDNINLNKKLASDFRSDVLVLGSRDSFTNATDTNLYWSTISSQARIDRLCNMTAAYPIVYDEQHDAYWIDEPFVCATRDDSAC